MKGHTQGGSEAAFNSSVVATLLRLPEVCKRVGLSKSEVYRRMRAQSFPQGVAVSPRVTVWSSEEVADWIRSQIAKRDLEVSNG